MAFEMLFEIFNKAIIIFLDKSKNYLKISAIAKKYLDTDLEMLPKGFYLLGASDGSRRLVVKLVKQERSNIVKSQVSKTVFRSDDRIKHW
jgi:hypothetical protein